MKKSNLLIPFIFIFLGACGQKVPQNSKIISYIDGSGKNANIALRTISYSADEFDIAAPKENNAPQPPQTEQPQKRNILASILFGNPKPKDQTATIAPTKLETNASGHGGTATIGNISMGGGAWPENWPEIIKKYENSTVKMTTKAPGIEGLGQSPNMWRYNIDFETTDHFEMVASYYRGNSGASGFMLSNEQKVGNGYDMTFTNNSTKDKMLVGIRTEGQKTLASLTLFDEP